MSERPSMLGCALAPTPAAAEMMVARLAAEGIDAVAVAADHRYHGVGEKRVEIRVPAGEAARARAILSRE